MSEETVIEGAFQLYRRFIRERDEARARARFARLKPARLDEWLADARAVLRVAEIHGA